MTDRATGASSGGHLRRGLRVVGVALRGAKGPFAVGIGGAVLYAGMTVAASLVLGWITDDVLLATAVAGRVDGTLLGFAVLAILGVALFKAIGVAGRRYGAYVAQYTLQSTHRRLVTRQYLDLPLSWHRRHPTGTLLSNANSDVESAFFLAAPLPMAVGAMVLVVVTGVLLAVTDPFLAAVGFSVVPLLAAANWHYQKRMRTAATRAQQGRADVAQTAHESFDAALMVKTLGREDAETRRFAARSEELRDRMVTVGRLRAHFDPIIEALPNVGILLVLVVGSARVRDGALTPGDLVLFAYLFRLLALPIRVFGWMLGEMPRAIVGWGRVERVLGATGRLSWGDEVVTGEGPASTDLQGVGFRYPTAVHDDLSREEPDDATTWTSRGVTDVDLTIEPGRTIAIVGPTGSGKSTIASLLLRLLDPDTGRVLLDGRDLRQVTEPTVSDNAAIVFQDPFLFDDTVRENITLGDGLGDEEVRAAARLARADEFITALDHGYDTQIGERGATLSGGQRQRIALARALVRRPRLLVLDDATSAVDPTVESEILRGLAESGLDTTVVIVASRLGSILLADESVYVADGRVVAHGPHDQMVRDVEGYRALVTAYTRGPA
ncbi:MAG: ABC transporter ATP-binding protein [Nitriliruptoraceae bacterium]